MRVVARASPSASSGSRRPSWIMGVTRRGARRRRERPQSAHERSTLGRWDSPKDLGGLERIHNGSRPLRQSPAALRQFQSVRPAVHTLTDDQLAPCQSRGERRHVGGCDVEQPADLTLGHAGIGADDHQHGRFRRPQIERRQACRELRHEVHRHPAQEVAGQVSQRIDYHARIVAQFPPRCLPEPGISLYYIAFKPWGRLRCVSSE